jgi:hypothetical protein
MDATDAQPAPPEAQPGESLHERCERALRRLAGVDGADALAACKPLAQELRDARQYPLLLKLGEAIARLDPEDARNRRLQAQALIELGQASVAVDVLEALAGRLSSDDREWAETKGLLGRAWKQIFLDSGDKSTERAQAALRAALAAYREPYEADPGNTGTA